MPKKVSADALRVPLNCLIAPATKTAITGLQNETRESQGEIIDRAVVLLAFGEEVHATKVKRIERVKGQVPKVVLGEMPSDFGPATVITKLNNKTVQFKHARGIRPKSDKTR